jgi:membrane protease YdiL (CAAX protease family)
MAVLVEGGLAVLAALLAWVFGVQLREQIAPPGAPLVWAFARGLAATLPMLAMFWWLVHSDTPTLRQLRRQVEWLIREMFPAASMGQFALVALLAGVGEELLFRGVIQAKLVEWTNPLFGVAVASLLFGLAHALSKLYFLLATVIGVFFGWMTWYFSDLVAPMVAHSVYDFVALMYLSRIRRSRTDDSSRPADGIEAL